MRPNHQPDDATGAGKGAPRASAPTPPRGPAPEFHAGKWWDALRFALRGRRLLQQQLHRLAALPEDAPRARVAEAQRAASQRLLRHLQVDLQVTGLQHLPRTPGLVVALHEGLADALCLATLPLPMRFVARREVFEWPDIGPALARCGHIAIEPEAGATAYRRLVRAARAALESGDHVLLFPQGCLLGIETAFLPGAFHLARRLAVPLLPIAITGSHRIWEHPFSARLRYGQRVAVQVLPPIGATETRLAEPDALRRRVQRLTKGAALAPGTPPPRHYDAARDGEWPGFRFELDPEWQAGVAHGVDRPLLEPVPVDVG
ncbi:MAG: 1-acyl-sn-glycerol-3-phosphate acyltransferase [Steroidobacteraceae bacterium]|nr:1-acyl-sn-glycerol-3-phosphate acyltransferase [Steroidobacteraceae bacterium]